MGQRQSEHCSDLENGTEKWTLPYFIWMHPVSNDPSPVKYNNYRKILTSISFYQENEYKEYSLN